MDTHHLDYEPLRQVLAEAGWDVQVADALHALRPQADGGGRLAIDRGGRLRFVQTRPLRPEQARRLTRRGRRYRLLRQEDVTLTVVGQVASADDLRQWLADLPGLLQSGWGN